MTAGLLSPVHEESRNTKSAGDSDIHGSNSITNKISKVGSPKKEYVRDALNVIGNHRRPLFGRYLDAQALESLKSWKYVSGQSTPLDDIFNYWWEWVANRMPGNLAPNCITMIGFISTITAVGLTMFFCPTFEEKAPRWLYFVVPFLIFLHQTCDAVDGKHARNLQLSSPLGQIIDHGCDTFSTVFAAFVNSATLRLGLSYHTFGLLALLQMQMFIYTWWDMHFHVYRSNTCMTGVTEGQLLMILFNLAGGFFGPDIWTTPLAELIPQTRPALTTLHLSTVNLQYLVVSPFYILQFYMALDDLVKARRKAPPKAFNELLACIFHIASQYFLFFSKAAGHFPIMMHCLILTSSSLVGIRMILSATCRTKFSFFCWPIIPYYCVTAYLLCCFDPLTETKLTTTRYLLMGAVCWNSLYLYDVVMTTVSDISCFLRIKCFSVF